MAHRSHGCLVRELLAVHFRGWRSGCWPSIR